MKKDISFFFFLLLLCIGVFHTAQVSALSMSPARQTVIIDPGKTEHIFISVKNDQNEPFEVKGSLEGFRIDEKTHRAVFGAREEAVQWGKVVTPSSPLLPGETKNIEFVFSVPKNASPGAHYLALFGEIKAGTGQVGIATRVGSLMFLYVGGEVKEAMNVLEFSSGAKWYYQKNAEIFLKTENQGSIHVFPTGKITVRNFRGNILQTFPINPENHLVIPQNDWSRIFDITFSPRDIGKIEATLEFTYGVNQKMILKKISFWYIPWWMIGIVSGVVVVGILFLLKRKMFSHKNRVT